MNFIYSTLNFISLTKFPPRHFLIIYTFYFIFSFSIFSGISFIHSCFNSFKFRSTCVKNYTTNNTPQNTIIKGWIFHIIFKTTIISIKSIFPKTFINFAFFFSYKYVTKMHTLLLCNIVNTFFYTFRTFSKYRVLSSISSISNPIFSFLHTTT